MFGQQFSLNLDGKNKFKKNQKNMKFYKWLWISWHSYYSVIFDTQI